jgi:hypothetical protein
METDSCRFSRFVVSGYSSSHSHGVGAEKQRFHKSDLEVIEKVDYPIALE